MAVIQNERDKILQAASVRFTPPPLPPELQDAVDSVKGIEILSDGTQFKVTGGVATPETITFAINFRLISGTVTWSVVQGTATLTGAGNTRFLSSANMSTDRVRIRASITVEGVTYTDEIDITRVYDGADGADGAPGPAGDAVDIVFRRAPTQPATPSPSAGTPSGWYSDVNQVPPSSSPMWSSVGTKAGGASNYTWQTPIKVEGSDGETGLSVVELTIYRRATSTPATPSGGTFNFTTQTLTPPSGWSWSVPSGTDPVYMSKAVASIQGTTGTVSVTGWTAPVLTIRNGEDGAPGSPGIRGTVQVSASRSPATWSDAAANNAILSYTGSSTLVPGDQVTLYNTTAGWAETRYWTGSVWQFQSQVIDGNLIVTGSLMADKITSGTFTGLTFRTAASGTRIEISHVNNDISFWDGVTRRARIGGNIAAFWASSSTIPGLVVSTDSTHAGVPAIRAAVGSTGVGVAIHAVVEVGNSNTTAHAFRGTRNIGGSSPATAGIVGASNGFDFYAEGQGNYGPFTGVHDVLLALDFDGEPGDIIIDGELIEFKGVSDAILTGHISTKANERGAIGVLAFVTGPLSNASPAAFIVDRDENGDPVMSQAWHDNKDAYSVGGVNSVGEGLINVCGQNGNISKGDLIVCSDMPGKGMKQSDDIVRSYTVAKARVDVTFDSPTEVKTIPCIYLCG